MNSDKGRAGRGPSGHRGQPNTPDSSRKSGAGTKPDDSSSNPQTTSVGLFGGVASTSPASRPFFGFSVDKSGQTVYSPAYLSTPAGLFGSSGSTSTSSRPLSDSSGGKSGQVVSAPLDFASPPQVKGLFGYTSKTKPDNAASDATDESSSRGMASGSPPVGEVFECPPYIGEHRSLSFDELKLKDYGEGRRYNAPGFEASISSPLRPYWNSQKASTVFDFTRPEMFPEMLKGPGAEIKVGRDDAALDDINNLEIYSLPQALLSHYSPYLTAACLKVSSGNTCSTIKLKIENPSIFSLFNLWMYYGRYTAPLPSFSDGQSCPTIDVQAWVLGDKLQSVDFKNYVMTRLHGQYVTSVFNRTIPTTHFDYVCASTKPGSNLRQFFLDVVGANFSNKSRVIGTSEEWDLVFQKYADARIFVLRGFMMAPPDCTSVKPLSAYMESKPIEQLTNQFSNTEIASDGE